MITVTSQRLRSTTGTLRAWRRPPAATGPQVAPTDPRRLGYNGWVRGRAARPEHRHDAGRASSRCRTRSGAGPTRARTWLPPRRRQRLLALRPARPGDVQRLSAAQGEAGHTGARSTSSIWTRTRSSTATRSWSASTCRAASTTRRARRSGSRASGPTSTPAAGSSCTSKATGSTAGCVAMSRADMRWLIRWVRPGATPRLVMGPRSYVVSL